MVPAANRRRRATTTLLEQFHDDCELLPNTATRCQRKSDLMRQE
jgi:hypothetical protein